jgi:hypothetical protein
MENRWNETDRGKPKFSVKNLPQCHFVQKKKKLTWTDTESNPGLRGKRPETKRLSQDTATVY